SADHGVCPLPEVAHAQGLDAKRLSASPLGGQAEQFLNEKYGQAGAGRWLDYSANAWAYLNRALVKERGLRMEEVEETLARWLREQPGVLAAYTRGQLLKGIASN